MSGWLCAREHAAGPASPAQSGPTEADVAVHNYRRRSSWMWRSRRRTLEVERGRRSRNNLDSYSGVSGKGSRDPRASPVGDFD